MRQPCSSLQLCKIFTDFNFFFTDRRSNKPFLIWSLTTQPHRKYVAVLPSNLSLIACFLTLMFHKAHLYTYLVNVISFHLSVVLNIIVI